MNTRQHSRIWILNLGLSLGMTQAATTPAFAQNEDDEAHAIYEHLLEANLNAQADALERQILLLDGQTAAVQENSSLALDSIEARHRESALSMLDPLSQSSNPAISADAHFRMALLLQKEKPKVAQKHAEQAVTILRQNPTSTPPWRSRLHLLAGDLRLKAGEKREAAREFRDSLATARSHEDVIRARIGSADVAFSEYKFEEAQVHLEAATKAMRAFPAEVRRRLRPVEAPLAVRRVWAFFRGGKYKDTLESLHDFFLSRPEFPSAVTARVLRDLEHCGGVALYESNDLESFARMAADPLAGSSGRRAILQSFQAYIRAGRPAEVEPIARKLEPHVRPWAEFVEFQRLRVQAAEASGNIELKAALSLGIAMGLSQGGAWRTATELDGVAEEARVRLVVESAEYAGAYFYNAGLKTRERASFEKSESAYVARLGEHVEGETRGPISLGAAQSALMADHPDAAARHARAAWSQTAGEAERKAALHIIAQATKFRFLKTPDAEKLRAHLESVDAYMNGWPHDTAARWLTLDAARLAADHGETELALQRAERLVTSAPENETPRDLTLAVELLLKLQVSLKEPLRSSQSLGQLERALRLRGIEGKLMENVEVANAAGARRAAAFLRREGRLVDAHVLLLQWVRDHGENPEAPFVLLDGARAAFENGANEDALRSLELFQQKFGSHSLKWEAHYWTARVLEANLAFRSAAASYISAAHSSSSTLPKELRTDALVRARTLFSELRELEWEGQVSEKLADMAKTAKNGGEECAERLAAASAYLKGRAFLQAKGQFQLLRTHRSATAAQREEAQLGIEETRLQSGSESNRARLSLRALVRRWSRELARTKNSAEGAVARLERALTLVVSENLDEAERIRCLAFGTWDGRACARLGTLEKESRLQVIEASGHFGPDARARLVVATEKIRKRWYDEMLRAAHLASDLSQTRRDALMSLAEQGKMEMRQSLSSLLASLPASHELRASGGVDPVTSDAELQFAITRQMLASTKEKGIP